MRRSNTSLRRVGIVAGIGIEPMTSGYKPDETTSPAPHTTSKVIVVKTQYLLCQLNYTLKERQSDSNR